MGVQYLLVRCLLQGKRRSRARPWAGAPRPCGSGRRGKAPSGCAVFYFSCIFSGGSGYCSISPVISRHSSAGSSIGTPPMRHPSA